MHIWAARFHWLFNGYTFNLMYAANYGFTYKSTRRGILQHRPPVGDRAVNVLNWKILTKSKKKDSIIGTALRAKNTSIVDHCPIPESFLRESTESCNISNHRQRWEFIYMCYLTEKFPPTRFNVIHRGSAIAISINSYTLWNIRILNFLLMRRPRCFENDVCRGREHRVSILPAFVRRGRRWLSRLRTRPTRASA